MTPGRRDHGADDRDDDPQPERDGKIEASDEIGGENDHSARDEELGGEERAAGHDETRGEVSDLRQCAQPPHAGVASSR